MDQATPTPKTKAARNPADTDDLWRRNEAESPCIKLCSVHPTAGICIGCHRTLPEIAGWSGMTSDQRRAIMTDLPGRKALLIRRRGGRSARIGE